jgi:hypothetical protein
MCVSQHSGAQSQEGESKLVTVIYPVADLVVPIPYNLESPKTTTGPNRLSDHESTQEKALIKLIHAVVAPESWRNAGGRGPIRYVEQGMALAVQQTKQAHEEIAAVLHVLRRLQDVEVALEIRLLSLSEVAQKKALDGMDSRKMTFLSATERAALLEAVQQDNRSEILQAPKITVFNGQRATIQMCDYQFLLTGVRTHQDANGQTFVTPINEPKEIGFRATACPTVSADRQRVFLDLQAKRTTLVEPVALVPVQVPLHQLMEDGPINKTAPAQIMQMFLQQPQINTPGRGSEAQHSRWRDSTHRGRQGISANSDGVQRSRPWAIAVRRRPLQERQL